MTDLESSRSAQGRAGRLSGWSGPASSMPWPSSSTRRPAPRCGPTGGLEGRRGRRGRPGAVAAAGLPGRGAAGGRGALPAVHRGGAAARRHRRARPVRLGGGAVRDRPAAGAAARERQGAEHRGSAPTGSTSWTGCASSGTSGLAAAAGLGLRRAAAAAADRAGGVRPADAPWFRWPSPRPAARDRGRDAGRPDGRAGLARRGAWAARADRIAPTIVGGSKKHGGADLGPTRAKRAWAELGVDGIGVADAAPDADADPPDAPADLRDGGQAAGLAGRVGLAVQRPQDRALPADRQRVPAPVAEAVGTAIRRALEHAGAPEAGRGAAARAHVHDPVFRALRSRHDFLTARQIAELAAGSPGSTGPTLAAVLAACATSARTSS